MKSKKYIGYYLAILCFCMAACDKMDSTYEKYIEGGERTYIGKVDSLKTFPGYNRIKLTWNAPSDPKGVKMKVYWNNRVDSIEQAIVITPGTKKRELILNNMSEGPYQFAVITFDDKGNSSIVQSVGGTVYGDLYASTLLNRALKTVRFTSGAGVIEWFKVTGTPEQNNTINTEVKYTDLSGVLRTVIVLPNATPTAVTTTTLPNYKSGNLITYRTLYQPSVGALDMVYSKTETRKIP